MSNSQVKLRENVLLVDYYREEIEALYVHIQAELDKTRVHRLQTLDELKIGLSWQIEKMHKETSANAYLSNFQPSSHLAALIYSSQNSSEPITVFAYQVQSDIEYLSSLLRVSFQTTPLI